MKNYKQKFLVAVLTVMTMVGVADASIAKNPAYAQSVDTKALASSQKLLKAVEHTKQCSAQLLTAAVV